MPKSLEEQYQYTQNRELSWLRFNRRVLEEAADPCVPILERLKFISIFSSNLDEFFMVRVGSLFDLARMTPNDKDNKTGWTPEEQLHQVYCAIPGLIEMKKQIYTTVMEELRCSGIRDISATALDAGDHKHVNRFFKTELLPILSPIVIAPNHPVPHLVNKRLYAAALLESVSGYSDADEQLKIVRYAQGEKAVEDSLPLAAAQFFTEAGDYSDAAERAAVQYAAYYGPIAESARAQYEQQAYVAVADLLMNLNMDTLPTDYADLRDIFRESCYQAGESYYASGEVYQAYPYYLEISDERRVKERLKEACYLVLGTWQDAAGNTYTFNLDGTCTLAGETLYFAVDGLTIRTGTSADTLTATHQLTGISASSAWLFDQRNGANVRIRLTKAGE